MSAPRRSVLAVAVLSMLTEEPMHPYRMQQLIKERNKGDIVNVTQRNSIYQTIDRLLRAELVEVESTAREANRPERTTYQITDAGRTTLREWLDAMLRTPAREYPEFPAALSFLPSLSPGEAIDALTARISHLEHQLQALGDEIQKGSTFLARLFLIESEYQQQVLATELDYVNALVDDLRTERITWPSAPVTRPQER
jgi:DNA-binding PadR family transcriptional regulator